tara:strand:- start:902 stop:2470 length:1569 start_codon:yes stop_codon:yes gene_type:complete
MFDNPKKTLMKKSFHYFLYTILFSPLLIYFGNRSAIAHDEGFYILQAKWILEKGNWIAPIWWGNISLDRTIGIQYLIATARRLFGESGFVTYLPITIGAFVMLFITYQLHKELVDKKLPLVSSLILSTSYLWINYSHMATQDIIFSSLIAIGIYSSILSIKNKKNIHFFIAGAWIGLAFMLKTYLTIIPLISIFPFLINYRIIFNKYFWLGTFIGFLPFVLWSYQIISIYGIELYSGIYNKLISLSKNNTFTNPIYYYLWNLPINTFPWCIFSIFGFIKAYKSESKLSNYFLFKYPLIVLVLISCFSTKTPYYPIQLLPLISINSYLGILYLFNRKNKFIYNFRNFLFLFIPFLLIIFLISINTNLNITFLDEYNKEIVSISLLFFAASWICVPFSKNFTKQLILILIGPYILFSSIVQTGLLSDRAKDLRIACQLLINNENLLNKKVRVISNEINLKTDKKIIEISLLMPQVVEDLESIENGESNSYVWTTLDNINNKKNIKYKVINESPVFSPWKLILKN